MKRFLFLLLMCGGFSAAAATYYIDPVNGFDTNNGTTAVAGSVNGPFKTIAKFARTNATSGDIGYFAPGVYRQAVQLSSNWTGTARVQFIGDPQNTQGFKDGSGVLVPPALCRWTGYTNTDSASSSAPYALDLNGKDCVELVNWYIIAPHGSAVRAIVGGTLATTNLTISNCVVLGQRSYALDMIADAGLPMDLTIDNSVLIAFNDVSQPLSLAFTSGGSADWDMKVVCRNSSFICNANAAIGTAKFGTTGFVGGGVNITNCFLSGYNVLTVNGHSSNAFPMVIRNSFIQAGRRGIVAQVPGQINEDFNQYSVGSGVWFDNVAVGANSHTNDFSPHLDFGASHLMGFGPRPLWSPLSSSPGVGVGGNFTPADIYRKARPAANALGAFEIYTAPEHSTVSQ